MRRCVSLAIWTTVWAMLVPPRYLLAAEKQGPPTTNPTGLEVMEQKIRRTVVSFKLVKIPAGSIEMPPLKAVDKPRTVQIKSFWIGQTEVTWDELDVWGLALDIASDENMTPHEKAEIIGKTRPSCCSYAHVYGMDWRPGHSGCPATNVSAHTALTYCKWLSQYTSRKYRLPTEAEWEYACRAGSSNELLAWEELQRLAWVRENSAADEDEPRSHPVAKKAPNAWGLHDTLGNVAEWVDGADGAMMVKGGSFIAPAAKVNSRLRQPYTADWQVRDVRMPKNKWLMSDAPFVGFRVVMDD